MTFVLNRRAFHQSGAISQKPPITNKNSANLNHFHSTLFLQQKSSYKIKSTP